MFDLDEPTRALGWLRYLDRKLRLPGDDWSKGGRPVDAWDNRSGAPTTNWYRFDAVGIAVTVTLAALGGNLDRSAVSQLMSGLVARMCRYHGFNEWVEQRGPDPRRDHYPDAWNGTLVPASEWGDYDSPGWANNGAQAKGFEPNPVEAQGAIYYKGFLNFVLGLRGLLDPKQDPDQPLAIVYDDDLRFQYSHSDINSILTSDFADALAGRSQGLCCEIHKLWPL